MDQIVKRLMENHRVLHEMAKKWSEIERYLSDDKTRQVLEHLVKLYYWSNIDSEDVNGWKVSVFSNCSKIYRLNSTNQYPPSKKIRKAIWDAWGDTFDSMEHSLNIEYSRLPSISIDMDCISYCADYIDWLSNKLSIDGSVAKQEVYDEIDKLLLKYKRINQ